MNRKFFSFFIFLLLSVGYCYPQEGELSKREERDMVEDAEYYYSETYYETAADLFQQLAEHKPEDPYYNLMLGICYTYIHSKRDQSIEKLQKVLDLNPGFNEANFYMGRAYAVNHEFDKAISFFNTYLQADNLTPESKDKAQRMILNCQNAKKFVKDSLEVEINNIGSPVNTRFEEYVPIITPDESVLIYTYRGEKSTGGKMDRFGNPDPQGEYFEDIMISYKEGESWSMPKSIGENINTEKHDASIAISVNGQQLFIYKSSKKNKGDIYSSELEGDTWSRPRPLKGKVNSEYWEGSVSLSSDGKTLYFASERPEGFGGRDLYTAELQDNGSWDNVKNLGPIINTPYDEDAPFIHPDKKTLYFSSKGHNSMGGYDIMYTYLEEDGWTSPENVGYPVNTIDDDRYYVLTADAETGYYSSAGLKSEKGGHDILTVSPGHFGKRPILALVLGVVNANDEPVEADITVSNAKTGENEGEFKSNAKTGKYMLALTPGNKYKIAIEVEGFNPKVEYLDVQSLETYVQMKHNIQLYSEDYLEGQDSLSVADEEGELQAKLDKQIKKYRQRSTKEGYDDAVYEQIMAEYGDRKMEGVSYMIDFGNRDVQGELELDTNDFGSTNFQVREGPEGGKRVLMGPFDTMNEVESYRRMLGKVDEKLEKSEILVIDHGEEKKFRDYFKDEFKKYGSPVEEEEDLHETLTQKSDTATTEEKDEFEEETAMELESDSMITVDEDEKKDGYEKAESKKIEGLSFKVEIAALKDTTKFDMWELSKYRKINKKTYPDGTTRYTFGPFQTLQEAEAFRQMLKKNEPELAKAFVTVFVFGKRKTLAEYNEDPCRNNERKDFSEFIGKDLNDTAVYNKLLRMGGNLCAEGLHFEVQIAAYRHPENYDYSHLTQFGEPKVRDYPDGITRFTLGRFKTFAQAEVLRQKCIKAGQPDAWVTPFYKGKRMLMQELIKENFYGKSIN